MPNLFKSYLRTALFVGALLLPSSLSANADAGRVSGKILDPRGVAVAGAHLKLLNSAAAVIREAKSDEQGSFILEDIDPGEYQLTAEEPTFASVTLDVSVASGQQKDVTLQFGQLASVSQTIAVVASAPSLLTPDPAQSIVIMTKFWTPIRAVPEPRSPFRDCLSKPHREESKPRSILLLALPGIMENPSPSTFRSGIFSIRTTCPPTPTGTAMPIRISLFLRRLKPSR